MIWWIYRLMIWWCWLDILCFDGFVFWTIDIYVDDLMLWWFYFILFYNFYIFSVRFVRLFGCLIWLFIDMTGFSLYFRSIILSWFVGSLNLDEMMNIFFDWLFGGLVLWSWNDFIIWSFCHLMKWWFGHLVVWSLNDLLIWWSNDSMIQSFYDFDDFIFLIPL